MTISEMIHEIPHMRYRLESTKHKETLDEIEEVLRHHKEINEVLDKIRAEMHATAEMHEDGDYYLREEWIDEIIDKYRAKSEDLGDYPDEIPNQFDNLTGSMNV